MWCLERFLKFLNYNAYIMCAVKVDKLLQYFEKYYCNLFQSTNFCSSAQSAYNLLMRNLARVIVLDRCK